MIRYNLSKRPVLWAVRELAARGNNKTRQEQEGRRRVSIKTHNPSYCVSSLEREKQGQTGAHDQEGKPGAMRWGKCVGWTQVGSDGELSVFEA